MRRIAQLEGARKAALEMGGADAVARQHKCDKLSCRERLALLLDPGSVIEYGILRGRRRGRRLKFFCECVPPIIRAEMKDRD